MSRTSCLHQRVERGAIRLDQARAIIARENPERLERPRQADRLRRQRRATSSTAGGRK